MSLTKKKIINNNKIIIIIITIKYLEGRETSRPMSLVINWFRWHDK